MKVGLVIGRFQPLHLGHIYLIEQALKHADKIIIAVGSSNVNDSNNPLSYKTRVEMLRIAIREQGWQDKILKIVPSPDDASDDVWLKKLLKQAGKFDIAIGNNSWTNGILKNAGYKVLEINLRKRKIYQGTHIRKLFTTGKPWQHLVPPYLAEFIKQNLK